MRNWWVNQNQTYHAEIGGGYVWSPKRNSNGARNQFYENMRAVGSWRSRFLFSGPDDWGSWHCRIILLRSPETERVLSWRQLGAGGMACGLSNSSAGRPNH